METNKNKSKTKNKYIISSMEHLTILKTCASGIIMGFIAYSGSFSAVPITFTLTALTFGTKSLVTTYATAFSQLVAGYVHTHSSRTGMAISTNIFHGFYIAKPEMRNRRRYKETRWASLKRFFITHLMNALVLNFMWETFTIYYILHTELFIRYIESLTSNKMENERKNESISLSSTKELEPRLILIYGITRYLAGCLSGMSTGLINQLWQRHLACKKEPCAIFNTDKKKLNLEWHDRRKLLSPFNMENWIKAFTMFLGALFYIASNIPNITGLHLLDLRKKKLISDVLVIHTGWLFLRDCAMLLFKKAEKDHEISLNTIQIPLIVEEIKAINGDQSEILTDVA